MSAHRDNRVPGASSSRGARLLLCALALLVCSARVCAAPESVKEYDLKAAYVYNFTKFASWPEDGVLAAQSPMVVGVFGDARLIAALETVTRGRLVNGHPISVKAWSPKLGTSGFHVLYVDSASEAQLAKVPGIFATHGLLTVGETDSFMTSGGAIRLVVEGGQLRFEINALAAERAGLTLSSQLLMLAKVVRKNL